MKLFSLETYVEMPITRDGKNFIVTTHARYPRQFFHVPLTHTLPSREEAKQFQQDLITNGARWLRTDLLPTQPYEDLPMVQAWKTGDAITVMVDGRTLAYEVTDSRKLKELILNHPKAHQLTTRECRRCLGLPRVNLSNNTLYHQCDAHDIRMEDSRYSVSIKIAAWNDFFSKRRSRLHVTVTLPHLIALGILKEPSNRDMMRRIRKIELFSFDENGEVG